MLSREGMEIPPAAVFAIAQTACPPAKVFMAASGWKDL